jgi:hypothetical protein
MNFIKSIIQLSLVLSVVIFAASCSEDDLNINDSSLNSHQPDAADLLANGRSGEDSNDDDSGIEELECFTISYPITLTLPDGGTQSINSEEELNAFFDQWFSQNPDALDGPEFQFPLTVQDTSGTDITVNSEEDFCELIVSCDEDYDFDDFDDFDEEDFFEEVDCFTIGFPVTIVYTDGNTTEVTDQLTLDAILSDAYEGSDSIETTLPDFQYPITVTLEDGTTQEISDGDALHQLSEDCHDSEDFEMEDCFSIQYPINIQIPEGEVVTVNNEEEEETLYDEFFTNNPDTENFPEYIFPITITVSDSSEISINDISELENIYMDCYDEDDDEEEEGEEEDDDED